MKNHGMHPVPKSWELNKISIEIRKMAWEDYYSNIINNEVKKVEAQVIRSLQEQIASMEYIDDEMEKFWFAVRNGYYEYVSDFIRMDPDDKINAKDDQGSTSLHWCGKKGDARLTLLLLQCGAKCDLRNDNNRTPLHYAIELGHEVVADLIIQYLSAEGFHDLITSETKGFSLHQFAARSGLALVLSRLLKRAPEYLDKCTDSDTRTPLYLSAEYGKYECIQVLVDFGANIFANADDGNLLHVALRQPFRVQQTALLIIAHAQNGEFYSARNAQGISVLHLATMENFTEIVVAMTQVPNICVDQYTSLGVAPLHIAAQNENLAIVKVLVAAGAFVDITDNAGQTPMHRACIQGQEEMIRYLHSVGAEFRQQDLAGHTALHLLAAHCQNPKAFEAVLSEGTPIDSRSRNFNTPLHFACMNGNKIAVEILIRHGANMSHRNSDNRNAAYLAHRWGHGEIHDMLKSYRNAVDMQVTAGIAIKMFSKSRNLRKKHEPITRRPTVGINQVKKRTFTRDQHYQSPSNDVVALRSGKLTPFLKHQMQQRANIIAAIEPIKNLCISQRPRTSTPPLASIPAKTIKPIRVLEPIHVPWDLTMRQLGHQVVYRPSVEPLSVKKPAKKTVSNWNSSKRR